MAVIPEGWAQCAVRFTGVGVPRGAAIVTGVENAGEYTALQVGSYIAQQFGEAHVIIGTDDVSMTSVDVKLGPNDTGPIATYIPGAYTGGVVAASASPNVAYLVEKGTLFGGRRARGRMFWPGVAESRVEDTGAVTGAAIATINAALDDIVTGLLAVELYLAILHTPAYTWALVGGQPRRVYADPGTVPVPYRVDSLTLDPTVATQRRRLR